MPHDLSPLAEVPAARIRLDEQELQLIERARHGGATWEQIAGSLGLTSRQAAQQRHQRLVAAARSRRHEQDRRYAPTIAAIRTALADLDRWIAADPRWDSRFARAGLVRATLDIALTAEPGALHALASHIADDLRQAGPQRLPRPVRATADELKARLSTTD